MCSPLRCLGMLMKRQGARPLVAPMVLRCSLRIPIPSTGRDGFRMLVRRDEAGVRLFTRNGQMTGGDCPIYPGGSLPIIDVHGSDGASARQRIALRTTHS
jgi:hypothetical protein